jgi:hypothetical protein
VWNTTEISACKWQWFVVSLKPQDLSKISNMPIHMTANWIIACAINFKANPSHLSAVIVFSLWMCILWPLMKEMGLSGDISMLGNASSLCFHRDDFYRISRGQFKEQFFQLWNRLLLCRVTIRGLNFPIFMCYLRESPKKTTWERRLCRGRTHISPMKMLTKSLLNFVLTNVGRRFCHCCRGNSIFFLIGKI